MALSRFHQELIQEFSLLPPTAIVPLPIAAVIEGVSRKTIRRKYKLVQISNWRWGVRKKDLRGANIGGA